MTQGTEKSILAKRTYNKSSSSSERDMRRLQRITRTVLRQLELALKTSSNSSAKFTSESKTETLFSGKHSLVHSLLSVSELMLKLDTITERRGIAGTQTGNEMLSESDKDLLQHFLRKAVENKPA